MKNKKVSGISFSGGNNDNSNNPSPSLFDRADKESYLTNQSEINYARNQPGLSFEQVFHPIAFPPSPVQKAGFSGIEILLLLGFAVAASEIIINFSTEKNQ